MPIYLAHGFRWPRDGFTGIRVHAIVHNLEDVAVEYIQTPHSRIALADSLRKLHPDTMQRLEKSGRRIDFLEQYDPEDESMAAVTQPYAFVCDRIAMIAGGARAETYLGDLFQTQAANASKAARERPVSTEKGATLTKIPTNESPERSTSPTAQRKPRAKTLPMSIEKPFNSPPDIRALSANVHDITNDHPIPSDAWDALAELRDKLAKDEKIGWWVVYNGDPERAFDDVDSEEEDDYDSEDSDTGTATGESMDEGVKELRPKVSVLVLAQALSKAAGQSEEALPGHNTKSDTTSTSRSTGLPSHPHPSGNKKSSSHAPAPKPLNTNPPLPSPIPPLRSPTGGRIPPPVPPPPPKSSARARSASASNTEHLNTNKDLPLSPVGEQIPSSARYASHENYNEKASPHSHNHTHQHQNSPTTVIPSPANGNGTIAPSTCPATILQSPTAQQNHRTGYRAPNQSLGLSASPGREKKLGHDAISAGVEAASTSPGATHSLSPGSTPGALAWKTGKEKDKDKDGKEGAGLGASMGQGLRKKIFSRKRERAGSGAAG